MSKRGLRPRPRPRPRPRTPSHSSPTMVMFLLKSLTSAMLRVISTIASLTRCTFLMMRSNSSSCRSSCGFSMCANSGGASRNTLRAALLSTGSCWPPLDDRRGARRCWLLVDRDGRRVLCGVCASCAAGSDAHRHRWWGTTTRDRAAWRGTNKIQAQRGKEYPWQCMAAASALLFPLHSRGGAGRAG